MDRHPESFVLGQGDCAVVAALDLDQLSVRIQVGDQIAVLPPEASRAVRTLLASLATGSAVQVVRNDGELTVQQAADLLAVLAPMSCVSSNEGSCVQPRRRTVGVCLERRTCSTTGTGAQRWRRARSGLR